MPPAARKLRGPQIYNAHDIAALSGAAFLARSVLDHVISAVAPGVRPIDLERHCREGLSREGAVALMEAIANNDGEPFGFACSVSVDDAVAHQRPTHDALKPGQLVTIDLMLAIDGWHADVADSVVVGGGGHPLLTALDAVWAAGLAAIGPGVAWSEVASAMNSAADANGVRLVRGLAGHGIGLAPHELPVLPLIPDEPDPPLILRPGLVFTLEPAITSGSGQTADSEDGWAILTADGAPAVGREAMIAVESDGFRLLGGPVLDDSPGVAGYNPLRTGPSSGLR
ncbi:MAG: M24 family metallopeptidase [Phycisphaerales bacterium JB064]